jgi:hypothetical protein
MDIAVRFVKRPFGSIRVPIPGPAREADLRELAHRLSIRSMAIGCMAEGYRIDLKRPARLNCRHLLPHVVANQRIAQLWFDFSVRHSRTLAYLFDVRQSVFRSLLVGEMRFQPGFDMRLSWLKLRRGSSMML